MKGKMFCLRFEKIEDNKHSGMFDVFSDGDSLLHEWTHFVLVEDANTMVVETKNDIRSKIFFAKLETIYDVFELDFDAAKESFFDRLKSGETIREIIHLD